MSKTGGTDERPRPTLEGERKQVTVLFADAVGFTALSEEMDPEEVSDLIAPAIEIMSEEVHRFEGTVAQYLGDGVMALFGAPVAYEDSARRAVSAALAIQERLGRYSESLANRDITFEVRIGLNTGLVVTGAVGEDAAMAYTAIGDTVNLASRMESTAGAGTVQATEETYRLTRDFFDYEDLGAVAVKGKKRPVKAYRPLRPVEAGPAPGALLRSGFSQFTGRAEELAGLQRRFEEASHGRGGTVAVVGEPGIGKSRLVREMRLSLPEGGFTCLEGGCSHYGESIAYLPVLRILKDYFGISDVEEAVSKDRMSEKLSALGIGGTGTAPLEEVLSLQIDDEAYLAAEPLARRERVFEAISGLFIAQSRRRPLVLVVEDLHWIDRTSEEFLSYLIGRLDGAAILLVLLYRPDYSPPWEGVAGVEVVGLEELSRESCSSLLATLLPGAPVSPELEGFIVSRTSGNPLFIEELAYSLLEGSQIARDGDSFVLSADPAVMRVPDTLQGIIASRLDRLDEGSKRTVQVAACIGREFSSRLLSMVAGAGDELEGQLSGLRALEFIYRKAEAPEPEYAFKHALTQDVAYGSLLLKRRKEIHAGIGRAIEDLYGERLEEYYEVLAYHYSAGGETENAIRYLRLAGDKAARVYSNYEAVALYREAARLIDELPETPETGSAKLGICLAMQEPLALLYYPEGSVELLEEAERLATEMEDPGSLAHIYRKSSRYYAVKGDAASAIEYSEKSLSLAQEMGDIETVATVAFDVCNARFVAGDLEGAAEITRRSLAIIEEQRRQTDLYYSGNWTAYAALSGCRGLALAGLGEFDEGEEALASGLASARAGADLMGEAWIEYCRLTLYFYKGDASSLIRMSREAIARFEEIGAVFVLGMCWSYLGCGLYFVGEMAEARECAEKGVARARESGIPTNLPLDLVALSLIQTGCGDCEAAEEIAVEALELSRERNTRQFEAYALFAQGIAAANCDPEAADDAVLQVWEGILIAEGQQRKPSICHGRIFLGEVLAIAGRHDEARENLEEAEALARGMGMGYWLDRARGALAELG